MTDTGEAASPVGRSTPRARNRCLDMQSRLVPCYLGDPWVMGQ